MQKALGGAVLFVIALVLTPLMAFASCSDTQTPVTVPQDPATSVDVQISYEVDQLCRDGWVAPAKVPQLARLQLTRTPTGTWLVSAFGTSP